MSVTREYQAQGKKRVNHIVARWIEGEAFDVGQPEQPAVRIDGTRKTGPGPVDMLLSALATCSAMDVVSILAKRRTPLSSLDIDVRGERAQTVPAKLTSIAIIYRGKILLNGTLDELKRIVLGPVEYEARFAHNFDAGELNLPHGVTLAARSADSIRFRVEAPQTVNPLLVNALTSRNAPLVSFQEVPRKLEQVYLKTMAEAQGVTYAA